jgi:thiamine biosynthesis protein ThiI
VPFAHTQRQIVALTPPETRVIFYRRFMLRIAERLALREGALALVTGDSIGQVASQTLPNLSVISSTVGMPVLRPLVGDDKEEIIQTARRIGTFPVSILPDVDCCSLFVPKHPETRARAAAIEEMEAALDVEELVAAALEGTERETFESYSAELPTAEAIPSHGNGPS